MICWQVMNWDSRIELKIKQFLLINSGFIQQNESHQTWTSFWFQMLQVCQVVQECAEHILSSIVFRVPIVVDGDESAEHRTTNMRMTPSDHDSMLTITNVTRQDAASYACRAFNSVGAATKTFNLIVQGKACIQYNFMFYLRRWRHLL